MASSQTEYYFDSDPCLVVDNVSKTFEVVADIPRGRNVPDNKNPLTKKISGARVRRVNALLEMSLVFQRGESVGIIGRNGSGKSTLSRIISGQEMPTTGRVYATEDPVLLGVNAALIPSLSGYQNILLGCLALGMSRAEVDRKFDAILELSGLESSIWNPMSTYSSGMESRLRFAIAASVQPEILIVDEALNTGDAQFSIKTKRRMDELRANAGCVLIVSHDMASIRTLCERAIWIDRGELMMDGDSMHVTTAYIQFMNHLAHSRFDKAEETKVIARRSLVLTSLADGGSGRRRKGN